MARLEESTSIKLGNIKNNLER